MDEGKVVYDGDKKTLFEGEYKNHHLAKPRILQTIDYINENTNRKISYDNYSLDDLLVTLKAGDQYE